MAVDYKKYTDQDLEKLSNREREIFKMRRDGLRCWAIGENLGITEKTVHMSLNKSLKKLNGTYDEKKEKEYQRQYHKAYYTQHREKIINYSRAYYNYEKTRQVETGYKFLNFEIVNMICAKGEKRKRTKYLCRCQNCGVEIWVDILKIRKIQRNNEKCPKCGFECRDKSPKRSGRSGKK